MKYAIAVWSALLLLLSFSIGSSERAFDDLSSGKLNVSFSAGADGMSVSYDGVQLITESSLWVHNPAWSYHYYGLPMMRDEVQFTPGKEAVLTHRSDSFRGQYRITVNGDQIALEFRYQLVKDVTDADMEYCFGKVAAAPIVGRPFRAVMVDGKTVQGVVPAQCADSSLEKCLLTPEPFKHLEIDSRAGTLVFDVTGDPAGIVLFDRRLSPYEPEDKPPVFWAGVLGTHLEYGKERVQTVTLTVQPRGAAARQAEACPTQDTGQVELPPTPAPTQGPARVGQTSACPATSHADVRSPAAGPVYVIPEPQEMTLTRRDFALTPETQIVVGDRAQSEDRWGAQSFAEEIGLLYGFSPPIVTERQRREGAPAILVGEAAINGALAAACRKQGLTAPDDEEGYALSVAPEQVLVLGHDRRGSYYGMQTLKQLVRRGPEGLQIAGCLIHDWPSLKFRGVHLFTGNEALPFHKKLIDRILSRYKINNIVLEVDFMKWQHDPGLAVDFSENQEDVRQEIEYARKHFIRVTPLLQSLGHCDWLFSNKKNRDIAENPDHPYTYCATNPRTYNYVLPFYDEVMRVFNNPRFVHIGHDEVQEPGGFPKDAQCKQIGAERIFIDDTLKVRDRVDKSGTRVMMWGDMMLAPGDSPDATNAESPEEAKRVRDTLPKDIVITDWHYAAAKPEDYKSIGLFKKEGFDAIAATWYTPANIEAFSQEAKRVGALGLLQTTWAGFDSNERNLAESFNQFSAMILAAEYGWDSGKTPLDRLPYRWDEEFRRQWDPRPEDQVVRPGFTLDLSAADTCALGDEGGGGWLGLGPQHDLSALPTGEVRLGWDLFRLGPRAIRLASALDDDRAFPERVEIGLHRKARALLFLHTCLWADRTGRAVGTYRVRYADGTSEEIPLRYGVNVSSWLDQRSLNGATRAWWEGRTRGGERVTLHRLQWDNPHPEKEIASVELASARTEAGVVVLGVSGLE